MGNNMCCMSRGVDENARRQIEELEDSAPKHMQSEPSNIEPIEDFLPVSSPPKPRKSMGPSDGPSGIDKSKPAHALPTFDEDADASPDAPRFSSPSRLSERGSIGGSMRSSTGKPRSSFGAAGGCFNMLIIGKKGSGKSSFMARFTRDKHPGKVRPTANKNIKSKNIDLKEGGKARTRLYEVPEKDIPTQAKASHAYLFIVDLTDSSSIEAAKDMIDDYSEHFVEGAQCVAIGTKSDAKNREVDATEFQNFANEIGDAGFELSAHTGEGYEEFFPYIEEKITNYLQS